MQGYVIQTQRSVENVEREGNPKLARFVGRSDQVWQVGYAKVWRTRAGAEQWITARGFAGIVVPVVLTASGRSPLRVAA